jgi:L-aspartate oxidase
MPNSHTRYLVPFDPKKLTHRFTDVLIIGGGLAGLRAANAVAPENHVILVTKEQLQQSNSNYAQGGIASVTHPDDHFDNHVRDTLTAGGDLCNRDVVEMVIREAPERVAELVSWGTDFDQSDGTPLLGREGGHSHHRILHALGDATGKEIIRAMIQWTQKQNNIQISENAFTVDLLTHNNSCHGALIWENNQLTMVWAKQTILCTGGCGQLYRESTNPQVATADGHAMAYRAGAELADMEFMQFHPTVLYIAGSSRSLITEAMRGEGAHLIDQDGYRFMSEYDDRGELAPRDIVSHSIVCQMSKKRHPCVYLDLSHLDAAAVLQRFPGIAESCRQFGIDITTDRIPVRPGAHYMIGGVTVDQQGQTSLDGLWAAGEVTSSGLHGANRLASNSLLESLVYGAHAGIGASHRADQMSNHYEVLPIHNAPVAVHQETLDVADITNSLKSLMWHSAGVLRNAIDLEDAQVTINQWENYVLAAQMPDKTGWELQNMLTVARTMVQSALTRKESRGVHLRIDFPETDNAHWNQHIQISRNI